MRLTQVFAFAPIIVLIFTTSLLAEETETKHSPDSYSKFDGIEGESQATGYMKLGDIKGESFMNGFMKLGDIKADYRLEPSYDDFEELSWWKELERLIWEAESDDFIWEDEAGDF